MGFETSGLGRLNMKKLILIGAGGHSKSVADALSSEYTIYGFIDENKSGMHMGKPILGKTIEEVPNYRDFYYFVSIGGNGFRRSWFEKIKSLGLQTINIIDPTACIAKTARLGIGNFIGKYAIINADSVIGDNNVINTRALVEHECVVGSNVHLSTGSVINGNVIVNDGVFLGSMAVCNGQLSIGANSIIGSGSVVIRDVDPNVTVVGVPAHVIKRKEEQAKEYV